jgi:hypothetical protein
MVDDAKTETWEREAREVLVQSLDTDNRACRLAGIVLALLHDGEDLLRYISRSQGD